MTVKNAGYLSILGASGYTFETSGNAVHCKKPQWTETKAFMGCALGTILKIDAVGTVDMCTGTIPVTGVVSIEPGCYPTDVINGFTKRRVGGNDFCGSIISLRSSRCRRRFHFSLP